MKRIDKILNVIFSVNPKGMIRPIPYIVLCMWKMRDDIMKEGFKPFIPIVGPKMHDILLRGEFAFGGVEKDKVAFIHISLS
jgi:hypothetical protein